MFNMRQINRGRIARAAAVTGQVARLTTYIITMSVVLVVVTYATCFLLVREGVAYEKSAQAPYVLTVLGVTAVVCYASFYFFSERPLRRRRTED